MIPNMMNEICASIYRRLRERAKLTKVALGLLIGVSRYTVAKFESGRVRPTAVQEQKLLAATGCSEEEFVEMICERMSSRIDLRVGIIRDRGDYRPNTAVVVAEELLQQNPQMLADPLGWALQSDVDSHRLMATALEKSRKHLVRLTGECRKRINGDGETASETA